jgi:hypothetical protein
VRQDHRPDIPDREPERRQVRRERLLERRQAGVYRGELATVLDEVPVDD